MNIIKTINNSEYKFILASNSPRRKELLKMIGIEFEVFPANIDENISEYNDFGDYVSKLSKMKANHIKNIFIEKQQNGKYLILAADTIVVINNVVLNKPEDADDAFKMLSLLSNDTHQVYTGFCLIDLVIGRDDYKKSNNSNNSYENIISNFEVTDVSFRQLSDEEIYDYIETGSPMDKAGAYGIQEDLGAVFVNKIVGDYYNVVGLPLQKVFVNLQKLFTPKSNN